MAFPFWRLYYNTFGNASVTYEGKTITPDKIKLLIIPPDTSFSTRLKSDPDQSFRESIVGKRIEDPEKNAMRRCYRVPIISLFILISA